MANNRYERDNIAKCMIHQRQALPLHNRIVSIFGALAALCIIGGVIAIFMDSEANTAIELFGAKITTGHVGVAFVAIGLLTALFIVKAVLKNQKELAALPRDY